MFGWLIGLLAPKVGEKFAPLLTYGIVGIGALLILFGAWEALKSSIIRTHDLKQEQKITRVSTEATTNASDERATDSIREKRESDALQEAIDNAKAKGTDPRAAYYACIKLQQSARAANRPAPAHC